MTSSHGNNANQLDALVEDVLACGPPIAFSGGGLDSFVQTFFEDNIPSALMVRFDQSSTLYLWPQGLVVVFPDSWRGDNLLIVHAADFIEGRMDDQGWEEVGASVSEGRISGTTGKSFGGVLFGGILLGPVGAIAGSVIGSSGARSTREKTSSQATGTIRRNVVTISTTVWDYPLIKLEFESNDEAMKFHARVQGVIRTGQSLTQAPHIQESRILFNSRDVEQAIKSICVESQMYIGDDSVDRLLDHEIEFDYRGPDKERERLFARGENLLLDSMDDESAKPYLIESANLGHQEAAKYLATIVRWEDESENDHWWEVYLESLSEEDKKDPENIHNGLEYLWYSDRFGREPVKQNILQELSDNLKMSGPLLLLGYLRESMDLFDAAAYYVSDCITDNKVPKEKEAIRVIFSAFDRLLPEEKKTYISRGELKKIREYLASCAS